MLRICVSTVFWLRNSSAAISVGLAVRDEPCHLEFARGQCLDAGAVGLSSTRPVDARAELPQLALSLVAVAQHVAVPTADGFLSTGDIEEARGMVAGIDFFETAFGAAGEDQAQLHAQAVATLFEEVHGWHDEPAGAPDRSYGSGGQLGR
jgi:hypothetical protein